MAKKQMKGKHPNPGCAQPGSGPADAQLCLQRLCQGAVRMEALLLVCTHWWARFFAFSFCFGFSALIFMWWGHACFHIFHTES
jgi:hypothetical protein